MSQLRRFLASKPLPSIIDGYVRDGLVLCFDGYQPPANGIWKDLSGGNNDMIQGSTTTYDEVNHCCAFIKNHNYTTGVVPLPISVTIEAVVGMSEYSYVFFGKESAWPYPPNMFFGNFLNVRYFTASGTDYFAMANLIDIERATDASKASAYQVWQNDTQSGVWVRRYGENAWQSGPTSRNTDLIASDWKLQFGGMPDTATLRIYALRIYNRCLTQEEMAANREHDIKRFNIK